MTAAVPGADGSIYIANGYGDSRIFKFDKQGNYQAAYSGKGTADGLCNCSHGMAVDTRYDQPLLLVCDRENFRLSHFDLDGKFVRNITLHLRRPCQVSFLGEYAVVSELLGRVTVLDKDNVPVAFLGYALQVTLKHLLKRSGSEYSPAEALKRLGDIHSVDIVLPTVEGREIWLRRVAKLDEQQQSILHQLKITLPERVEPLRIQKCSENSAIA